MSKPTFDSIYELQTMFQQEMVNAGKYYNIDSSITLPEDNTAGFSYHIQALVSEMGEVLSADKRWKNVRNGKIDETNKLEELADCFIVLMNVAIYSGFESSQISQAIVDKIMVNFTRAS